MVDASRPYRYQGGAIDVMPCVLGATIEQLKQA